MSNLVLYAPDYASIPVVRCSPPSLMVQLLLEEKGLDYRVEWLSFSKGEHKTPAMLARNPRGTIPVLSDDGVPVFETFAILEYIERKKPDPPFLPAEDIARGLTRFHESAYIMKAGMALFGHLVRGAKEDDRLNEKKPLASAPAELLESFREELERFDEYLEEAPFAAGARFGLADLTLFAYVATASRLGLSLAAWPQVSLHHDVTLTRPSVAAAWPVTWNGAITDPS